MRPRYPTWWNTHLTADGTRTPETPATPPPWAPPEPATPAEPTEPVAAPAPPSVPQQRTQEPTPAGPSAAYLALAQLGCTDGRLALSAADCTALEALAAGWFARGVDADYLTHALTAGLPAQVDSPVGFVRRRLNDKMPPHLPTTPTPPAGTTAPTHRLLVECTQCGAPGPCEALPDGLCRPCRRHTQNPQTTPTDAATPPIDRNVKAQVSTLRELLRLP